MNPIIARCGYRCDLCPAYRENIHGADDQQRVSDGWFKYYGFRIPPDQICCDGCLDERPEARRIDASCPIRPCVIVRDLNTCAQCSDCGCERFASRTVTREWVEQRTGTPTMEMAGGPATASARFALEVMEEVFGGSEQKAGG